MNSKTAKGSGHRLLTEAVRWTNGLDGTGSASPAPGADPGAERLLIAFGALALAIAGAQPGDALVVRDLPAQAQHGVLAASQLAQIQKSKLKKMRNGSCPSEIQKSKLRLKND